MRAKQKENELEEGLHALRGVCLRSFPEFPADPKLAGLGRGRGVDTGCPDFTITTTRYLEQSPERMGDGIQAKPNQGKPAPGSEGRLMYAPFQAPGLRLGFPARLHRLSPRKHSQVTRARALNPLAADAGRTQLELPHHLELLPLVQVLAEDREKLGGAGKAAAEKFTGFFDLLDEIKERHQLARVLEDDEE
ncbi:hypothetical protein EDB86DRAFT_3071257 [Lactarius hatsudake]|nr:hypothetical protein EDB86DRAFT_3071257 [Lactarius hatsudake]